MTPQQLQVQEHSFEEADFRQVQAQVFRGASSWETDDTNETSVSWDDDDESDVSLDDQALKQQHDNEELEAELLQMSACWSITSSSIQLGAWQTDAAEATFEVEETNVCRDDNDETDTTGIPSTATTRTHLNEDADENDYATLRYKATCGGSKSDSALPQRASFSSLTGPTSERTASFGGGQRRVQFSPTLVTQVLCFDTVPAQEWSKLYYSCHELQRIIDEHDREERAPKNTPRQKDLFV